jgi:peptidoglycan/LPS O-acetylase OafA/YrhL
MNLHYVRGLDGVRAMAIILVLSFHAGLNYFGWLGVQLFFVLSGFLITGILWNEKDEVSPTGFKLKRFWVRRSLRIFPLYFGVLILTGILYMLFQFPSYYPTYIPYLATYTFNYTRTIEGWQGNPLFTHFWSLSIEEQFYFSFPLIIFFASKKFIRAFMIVMIVLAPIIRYFLFRYFSSYGNEVAADATYWHTLSHVDAFFMGGAIHVFNLEKKIRRPQLLLAVVFAVVLIAGLVNYLNLRNGTYTWTMGYGHAQSLNYEYVWHFTLLNLLFGALVLNLVSLHSNKNFISKILENQWMVKIGRVSYGMYIFHWVVLGYIFNRLFPAQTLAQKFLLFLPYVFVVYAVSALSYRFYESWFIMLKNRLFRGTTHSAPRVNELELKAGT